MFFQYQSKTLKGEGGSDKTSTVVKLLFSGTDFLGSVCKDIGHIIKKGLGLKDSKKDKKINVIKHPRASPGQP